MTDRSTVATHAGTAALHSGDATTEPPTMSLKRTLGIRDVVLFNLVAILGLRWIATAAKAYRVYYAKVADKDAPDGYLMDHSSVIYVMRPGDGRFVATFTHESTADEIAERLQKLIANS